MKRNNKNLKTISLWVAYFLILPLIGALIYNQWSDNHSDKQCEKFLALALSPCDTTVERNFENFKISLTHDIHFMVAVAANADYCHISEIITNKISDSLKDIFDTQITICSKNDQLLLDGNTLINCRDFFNKRISQFGKKTNFDNIFIENQQFNNQTYVIVVKVFDVEIFIEFKNKDFALPELSFDYSLAHYKNGSLIEQQGRYNYPLNYKSLVEMKNSGIEKRVQHYSLTDSDDIMVLTRRLPNFHAKCQSFSFIFLALLAVFLLFYVLKLIRKKTFVSFAARLQFIVIIISLAIFVITFIFSVLYLMDFDKRKNNFFIREKSYSVLLQMEKNYANESPESIIRNPSLLSRLADLANIFFVEPSLFTPEGKLLAEKINYENHNSLEDGKMSTEVFEQMNILHRNFYNYYKGDYLYCYLPFRNHEDKLLGYLELRFLYDEEELARNTWAFTTALLNIFVFLIIISSIFIYFIIFYLMKPLRILQKELSNLKLDNNYKTIDIHRNDEIGQLIDTYNKVIMDLEESAKKLSESERNSAWNEMAKQIAHEIKNPLTPMRLNIQQIERVHKNKNLDFDEKFPKFLKILLQQIDSLSIIADEFRDFAQMNFAVDKSVVNLTDVLNDSLLLFENEKITIEKDFKDEELLILADNQSLGRVFINLLQNACQAIASKDKPLIVINIDYNESNVIVKITDNGGGISDDVKSRIFEPNFTTKSSGMGLGLAISKRIVESFDGKISFISNKFGTTFSVLFPKV